MTREEIQQEAEKRFPLLHISENAPKNSRRNQARFIEGAEWAHKQMESENAALRQQVKDMGEVIKELRGKSILDSIDVRFDGITVQGDDRILSLTLSRKS